MLREEETQVAVVSPEPRHRKFQNEDKDSSVRAAVK